MARKTSEGILNTKTQRLKLKPRAEPYWRTIEEGRAVGYRRIKGDGKPGSWVARRYDPTAAKKMLYQSLGAADDFTEGNGAGILTFGQAQAKAIEWFKELANPGGQPATPLTVEEAMNGYFTAYVSGLTKGGGKATKSTETTIKAHILPTLGSRPVQNLTKSELQKWLTLLAESPARLRSGPKTKTRKLRVIPGETKDNAKAVGDAKRARKSTANRILTVLKAGLNRAFDLELVPSNAAWVSVKPFPKADAPRIRSLSDDESRALVQACPCDLRALVSAALLTGADYSELGGIVAKDVNLEDSSLTVSGKRGERVIRLSGEAIAFFTPLIDDLAATDRVFTRKDGSLWTKSVYFRPLHEACRTAKIEPAIGMHILRHTYATRMLRRGMPMHLLSKQLGHASVVMTMKHYAHIAPNDVLLSVQAVSGTLNLSGEA